MNYNKPLIAIILLFIYGGLFILFKSLFWNEKIPWKIIMWWILIYLICIFPIIIEMIKVYSHILTLKQNFGQAFISTIKNNSYYSVLFSLLMAGYIDLLFSAAIKKTKLHIIVFFALLIVIWLAFYGNLYVPNNIETLKLEASFEIICFMLQVTLAPLIAILTLYLKSLSTAKTIVKY
ncbi:MAG: hypothetical protein IPN29_18990 [Saprospiraceae bacterium]|nr:hypothetical protein [Saprospiraceae bacterium]